jgi:hypothetical protein
MRRSAPIVIVAIVLSLLATATRAATTNALVGHDCTGGPGSSPFDPIECRLDALLNGTTPELGELWASLNRESGTAGDRVAGAHGICSFGKTGIARLRLRRAKTHLDRYVARLRMPAAQTIPSAIRDPLVTEALAIAAEVAALRARLDCPIDA